MSDPKKLCVFLLLTLLIRSVHVGVMPSLLIGMNPATACSAKLLLQRGANDYNFSFPPLPAVIMAGPAWVGDVPPGFLVTGSVLVYSLLYAAAFWLWLDSLAIGNRLKNFSCLVFLFLPMNNGYEGLDSAQTLLSGMIFLLVATMSYRQFVTSNRGRLVAVAGLSSLLPMTRSEYCVLLPIYVLLLVAAVRLFSRWWSIRIGIQLCAAIGVGVGLGALAAMAFRYSVSGQFGLVPPKYSCWTFLDGVPSSWLAPGDGTEFARRVVGIKKFGHPSEYGYSLAAMILANPWNSLEKFVMNIPRWFFELGGRAQVLPTPAAALAVVGFVAMVRLPFRRRRLLLSVQALGMIGATVPMIGVMLYAEYLRPAYPAMCLAMSYGALAIATALRRLVRGIDRQTRFWLLGVLLCSGMEFLYFYAGANHPDALVLSPIGTLVDRLVERHQSARVLLDPYSSAIDSTCRATLWNHSIEKAYISRYGHSTTEPATAFEVFELYDKTDGENEVGAAKTQAVIVWGDANAPLPLARSIQRWREAGFHTVDEQIVVVSSLQKWSIALCIK